MKASILFLAISSTVMTANAQLYNNGGTIKISNGAVIFCNGSVTNAAGTIVNDGKLEVQGSFINNATYNSTLPEDSLLLTGPGAVTLNGGGATIYNLQVNKTGGGGVTLTSTANIGATFEMLSGTFSTDPTNAYELTAPFAATFTFAAGKEISGKVRRNSWTNGTPKVFNGTNMLVKTTGGSAPTSMLVNMIPNGDPTGVEREVKRTFNFTPTGGAGYTADVTFPYKTTEVNTNVEATLAPWYFTASEWNAKLTGNTVNVGSTFVSTSAIDAVSFSTNQWKLADPNYGFNVSTFLRGAWNSGTGLMNTTLNSSGLIPLTQPFDTTGFNYPGTESVGAIPNANVVDWVLLELRKPTSGLPADALSSTIIGKKAVFLLNNGALADLNGLPIPLVTINKQGASFVVVRHRNHLAVMSNSIPSNAAGTFANNFGLLANSYKKPGASSEPEILLPSSTSYGLWPGDANRNNSVNSIDLNAVKSAISILLSGYRFQDVNLNGGINSLDLNLLKATISVLGSSSAAARAINNKQSSITTHVPD